MKERIPESLKSLAICFACLWILLLPGAAQDVYKDMQEDKRRFHGPAGETLNPTVLEAVSIGLFAPGESGGPMGRDILHGALLAVEQANAAGGFRRILLSGDKTGILSPSHVAPSTGGETPTLRVGTPAGTPSPCNGAPVGIPFKLVRRWAENPWTAGSKEVIHLVYRDRVWGIIAAGNGADHIALQVAAKAHIAVIAPVSTTVSLTSTGVPWIFRLPPNDVIQSLLLAEHLKKTGIKEIGLISSTDHDNRTAAATLEKTPAIKSIPPLFHFKIEPETKDFKSLGERIHKFRPGALIACLSPENATRLLRVLGKEGISRPIGFPWMPGGDMRELRKIYKGTLFTVSPFVVDGGGTGRTAYALFHENFKKRFGREPSAGAAYSFDAARL
ncbi:MAG: amino acid ABC transporter substrate-binding protein, partial [bacterium]|nr:amino acid ABC transporter substrate-binding protein [bacterium]